MKRYETKIEDGTLYVEAATSGEEADTAATGGREDTTAAATGREDEDGWLTVGSLADVYDLVGGDEYDIQYDRKEAAYANWLDTDDDDVMTIDVRTTLAEMSYPREFVTALAERDGTSAGDDCPERTTYFAEIMTEIWDSKGNLDHLDDNPFG